jgi:hypothetical protein
LVEEEEEEEEERLIDHEALDNVDTTGDNAIKQFC